MNNFRVVNVLITLLLLSVNAMAQQTGSITGKITTSDGHNAAFVSVKLIGTPFGATTNEKGDYEINKVNPGKYTIRVSAVGLSPQEKTAEVTELTSTKVDFVLREDLSTLE